MRLSQRDQPHHCQGTGEAVEQIIMDEVGQSIRWAVRSGGLVAFAPNDSPLPQPGQEPYIDSTVPEAILVAQRLRAEAGEQTTDFTPVYSFLTTMIGFSHHLTDSPS